MGSAIPRSRFHRQDCLGVAPDAPARLPHGGTFVSETNTLRRLFRYARPYRGRLAWAVVGMLVYAAGSAGLAWLIQWIFDDVLSKQQHLALIGWAIVGLYLLKGIGSSRVFVSDGERRASAWSWMCATRSIATS